MSTVTIPIWTAQGFLPPIDQHDPTSTERSPYVVTLTDIVRRFGNTPKRQTILSGLLAFRAELHAVGLNEGFQWIDGSFLENVEAIENRDPNDVDVVTFFMLPIGQTQEELAKEHRDLFSPPIMKARHHVDAYFVSLDSQAPEQLVESSVYWYGLWSHRRNYQWKGYLQIDLSSSDDQAANVELARMSVEGALQ